MRFRQRLYGLTVDGPFDWSAPTEITSSADLSISFDPEPADQTVALDGDVLGAATNGDERFYSIVQLASGHVMARYFGWGDVLIDTARSTAVYSVPPGADHERMSVLLSGSVLAVTLLLLGEPVLHASAVERDGAGVAIVGHSGGGKSTLAGLACRAGARFVTDDVLRLGSSNDGFVGYRGGNSFRLRPGSRLVTSGLVGDDVKSADERTLWSPPRVATDTVSIGRVILPRLSREATELALERMPERDAMFAVLSMPRVLGWVESRSSTAMFECLADLVARVPVFRLTVPWGLEPDAVWIEELSAAIFG